MIRHTVFFSFKAQKSENEKQSFFDAVHQLSLIEGVQDLEIVRQTSPKNDFEFGILMNFKNNEIFNSYSTHPDHDLFIKNHWLKMVELFLEIDYEPISDSTSSR